jgi:predicted ferric reductase
MTYYIGRAQRLTAAVANPMHGWPRGGRVMLFLVVLCVVLWLLGMMTAYTLGGLLHILLVVAVIFLLIHVIQGRSIA